MTAILIALNVLAGLFLVGVVLLQSGKGADMGAAFGGASSAVFGPSGAGNLLTKITAVTAAVFMGTSLALAVISSERPSVFDDAVEDAPVAAMPAMPQEAEPAAPIAEAPSSNPATAEAPGQAAAETVDPLADVAKESARKAVEQAAAAPPIAPAPSDKTVAGSAAGSAPVDPVSDQP